MSDALLTFGVTAAVIRAWSHRLPLDSTTSPSASEAEAHHVPTASAMLCQALRSRGVDVDSIAAATSSANHLLIRGWIARRAAATVLRARNTAETPQIRSMLEETQREMERLVEDLMLGSDSPTTGPGVVESHVQSRRAIERANEHATWDTRTAWRGQV
jgi:hypothetical protein